MKKINKQIKCNKKTNKKRKNKILKKQFLNKQSLIKY